MNLPKESQVVEYKRKWRDDFLKELCAFANSQADLIFDDTIVCPLVLMPSEVMWTLRNRYLVATYSYKGLDRIETLEMPDEGLREIICNAIMHRDYTGTFIQMRVWDDIVELWNPGRLPQDFSKFAPKEQHDDPKNPVRGYDRGHDRGHDEGHDANAVHRLVRVTGTQTLQRQEIMGKLGIRSRDKFRENYKEPAMSGGYIDLAIPDKPKSKN